MPDRDLIAEGRKLLDQATRLPVREGMFESVQTAVRSLAGDLLHELEQSRARIAELEERSSAHSDRLGAIARLLKIYSGDDEEIIPCLRKVIERASGSEEDYAHVTRWETEDDGSEDWPGLEVAEATGSWPERKVNDRG
jgi:hypothetical protein